MTQAALRYFHRPSPRTTFIIRKNSFHELATATTWGGESNEDLDLWACHDNRSGGAGFVARHGKELLGFVRLVRDSDENNSRTFYRLYNLHVKPRYRGMGVGEALTRHVMKQARTEGAKELYLEVIEGNIPALALYRKLGFEEVTLTEPKTNRNMNIHPFGQKRLTFVKTLSSPARD